MLLHVCFDHGILAVKRSLDLLTLILDVKYYGQLLSHYNRSERAWIGRSSLWFDDRCFDPYERTPPNSIIKLQSEGQSALGYSSSISHLDRDWSEITLLGIVFECFVLQ